MLRMVWLCMLCMHIWVLVGVLELRGGWGLWPSVHFDCPMHLRYMLLVAHRWEVKFWLVPMVDLGP